MLDTREIPEERYELINGRETMLASASIPHLRIQRKLSRIIDTYLKGKRCELFAEARVVFDDRNWLQPDLLVVCDKDKIRENHIEGAPDFIAEILSPTTQFRDFGIKKDTYEKFGVKEYWLINPKDKTILVYLLRDGRYQLDNVYHKYSEEELKGLLDSEKPELPVKLKLSLYDDLEIDIAEVFEE